MTKQQLIEKGVQIDAEDEHYLDDPFYQWYVNSTYEVVCTNRSVNGQQTIQLSRLIMATPSNMVVDHKNGNRLDMRKSEMRNCTFQQNSCNRKPRASGTKGVGFDSKSNAWRARITINNKTKFLGNFPTQQEAQDAYNKAAVEIHGEFARII